MTDATHAQHPDVSVRAAGPNDAPAVGLVQSVVWRDAFDGILPAEVLAAFDPHAFAAVWRDSLANPAEGALLLVALQGEQVVGYAAWSRSPDDDAAAPSHELLVLGVHPAARRQGHGSRLLRAVVDTARTDGARDLGAWVAEPDVATGTWLRGAGLADDGARRIREVGPQPLPEIRFVADLAGSPDE